MTLRIVVDMNLSPDWVALFEEEGWSAVHWSTVGDPRAADRDIMRWARAHHRIVFTHDLDFGTALALTSAAGPSVIQIRGQNVLPDALGSVVAAAMRRFEALLTAGALVTVDPVRAVARLLPLLGTERPAT